MKKQGWFSYLITQVINANLKKAGFGEEDLKELRLLVEERRRLKRDAEDSANTFLKRIKELGGV